MSRARSRSRCGFLFTVVALAAMSSAAWAQSTATLRGTVSDAQGGVLPGASVVVRNQATGVERAALSDADGQYLVASLPPGLYRLEVSLSGFQSYSGDVELDVASTLQTDVRLGVGPIAEQINVTGAAPVIETSTTSVGQVISQRVVQDIPLNGRHFVDLGLLIPGSVTPPQSGFLTAPLRGQGSFSFNTAGNREDTVNFMINGINLNDMVQNQITFQPSINTVSEFKVDNSTFSAEYGRNSGAIVNIATRSGTNDLHGEAFEFFRNDALDSRNYFNQPPARKSPFNRNQFGASVGGPIVRSRTFFFGSYEGLRQRQGIDINSGVLRDDQRAAVTDPVSRNLLQFIPTANTTGAAGEGRFLGTATAPVDIDQWTGDVHHVLGGSDNLHGYYAFQRDKRGEPTLQLNTIPGFGDTRESTRQIGTFNATHIFGPRLVNEVRFGFNRIHITFTPNAQLNPTDYGINVGVDRPIGLPQIIINGLGLNFGGPQNFPQGRTDTTFVLSDSASYLRGNHTIKFGGEWRHFNNNNFTSDTGQFQFANLAAFQTGVGNSFTIVLGDRPSDIVQQALSGFVQDTLRASSRLTFELGLRYDLNMAPTEAEDRFVVFDAATASLVQVGTPGGPESIYKNSHNIQPRVGVIFTPAADGRTVVRGAYAILVDQPVTNAVTPTAANPPLATPLTFTGNIRLDSAATTALAAGVAPVSVNPDFEGGRIHSYNVNVERQIGSRLGVMVGYFGSSGDRLRIARNLNQFVNSVRPYPTLSPSSPILPGRQLGNITEVGSVGESNYNALWLTANQRPFRGLQFNASYTLSKSTDFNSLSNSLVTVQDSFNPADSEGPSDFDARHRFVINAIYDLPFTGNAWKEGWQVGAIVQAQSGNPISIVTNIGTFTGVVNSLRPDLVGDPVILEEPARWFENSVCDPRIAGSCGPSSVFALPVSADGVFHFGNLGRNAILGPGFSNTDLSLIKNIGLSNTARLQLRVEVFNLFNRANFGQPGRIAVVGSTAFGQVTNTRFPTGDSGSARQVQFAAKVIF
jgi:Carboxypeptidase regulatory-like domain